MPKKDNVRLDAKAWQRIWRKYNKWFSFRMEKGKQIIDRDEDLAIKRIVNAELKRIANAK